MSLASAIALIVVITEFILWFGYSQIASLAYGVYLNVFERERIQKQRKIKRDILNVKHELARTSSQDQFAKWAKLRRKLDSKMNELEKITSKLGYLKTSFEIKFTTFLWVIANGIQVFMVLWYRSSPVLYLPQGWFSPISWIFSLPFAPSGSVSVPFWFLVCRKFAKKVIQTTRDAAPLYNKYAPEPVKQNGPLVVQWCNTQIRKHTPVILHGANAYVKEKCRYFIGVSKNTGSTGNTVNTKHEGKEDKQPSTNGTSDAPPSKEEEEKITEKIN